MLPSERCASWLWASWLFAGSQRSADRAAVLSTPIGTAKLDDIDRRSGSPNVLAGIADMSQHRLAERLPWNWKVQSARLVA